MPRISLNTVLVFLILALVIVFASMTLERIKVAQQANLKNVLETVLKTTQRGLHIWAKKTKEEAEFWANFEEVGSLVSRMLANADQNACKQLSQILTPVSKLHQFAGFFILTSNGTLICASPEFHNMGPSGLELLGPMKNHFSSLKEKKDFLSLPFFSSVLKNKPVMTLTSPITRNGKFLALLGFYIYPILDFTQTVQQGKIGETGETYAFDVQGRFITESRFDQQLLAIGLIRPGEQGILSVEIRDPEANLPAGERANLPRPMQPLTWMAKSATSGHSGVNVEGYRDYRGVPVIGAWLWDNELGLGLATEIDVSEAYEAYRVTRNLVVFLLGFAFLGGIGVNMVLWKKNRDLGIALRFREEFLAIASHELKTPLTSLTSQMELIDRYIREGKLEGSKEKISRVAEIGKRELQRLSKLINSLLDVTRIIGERFVLQTEHLDLAALAGAVVESLQGQLKSSGYTLNFVATSPVYADVDRLRIEQVIFNLLSNAMKYGRGKPIDLTITQANSSVRIRVQDRGIGISSEDQKKLFRRFQRIPDNHQGGLGLGLFITNEIVHAHSGSILVESKPGEGSIFTVILPLKS